MSQPLKFVINGPTRTAKDFQTLVSLAERFTRHGRVEMNITEVSGPTLSELPEGGSSWHEYTIYGAGLEKLFPHPDLVPFIDQEHVKRNVQLMRERLAIVRKHKMGAAVSLYMPRMLPNEFFEKYPHLRGARIDHPRRTRREAFAICVDLPEGRAFCAQMFGQLAREIPELSTVRFDTNDAGGGICWADWLYNGPNGPMHCRHRNVAVRVKDLIESLRSAAPEHDLDFTYRGNFSDAELEMLKTLETERFRSQSQHGGHRTNIGIGPVIDNPVMGIIDAVGIVRALGGLQRPETRKITLAFGSNYGRGHHPWEVADKIFQLLEAFLAEPAYGLLPRMQFLRKMCAKWVGEEQADTLLEAFYDLNETIAYRHAVLPLFTANYVGVSMRHINRPLVPVPRLLTPDEESYWLPYVFNPHVDEARNDYVDLHGGRMTAPTTMDQGKYPRAAGVSRYVTRMNGIAERLEKLQGAGAEFFRKMGASVRIHASIIRSVGNFYAVQVVRDRNADKFNGPELLPPKVGDWTGDPDLQAINELMRDELDNTTDLIRLLEAGGISQVQMASKPEEEDTFLLGPDLINQLKKKCQIMTRHWRDVEKYLTSPHK